MVADEGLNPLDTDYGRTWKRELDEVTSMLGVLCGHIETNHTTIEKYELAAGNVPGLEVWWLEQKKISSQNEVHAAVARALQIEELEKSIADSKSALDKLSEGVDSTPH